MSVAPLPGRLFAAALIVLHKRLMFALWASSGNNDRIYWILFSSIKTMKCNRRSIAINKCFLDVFRIKAFNSIQHVGTFHLSARKYHNNHFWLIIQDICNYLLHCTILVHFPSFLSKGTSSTGSLLCADSAFTSVSSKLNLFWLLRSAHKAWSSG